MAGNGGGVCGRCIFKILLLIAVCACLCSLHHMPHNFGELSEQLQAQFDLPMTTFSQSTTTTSNSTSRTIQQRRRSVIRRWKEWNQQQAVQGRGTGSSAGGAAGSSCKPFQVLFDQAPQHGCVVAEQVSIPFCRMEQLRIDVAHIESPVGGEELQSVMGRDEDVEYPKYHPGSWTVSKPLQGIPTSIERPTFHYIQNVLSAVTVVKQQQQQLACVETWPGTTLFLTRYEYVNLYHTMTDFFNAFFSYPKDDDDALGENNAPVNVIFLDAHAKGNLDSVWRQVFGNVTFVKKLPEGGVCFQRAVFIPPGYVSPLYPKTGRSVCPNPIMMEDFSNHFMASYHLEHVNVKRGSIVIIDRVPYIAHPRSKPKRAERTVNNMKHLLAYLIKLPNVESVSVVHLEELTFHEQLRVVREAHILIGNHGAGLTHMVFMSDGSHVIEFDGHLPFFTTLARWKPHVGHHVIRAVSGHLSEEYIKGVLVPTITSILR